jgi:hypothetical protein
MSSVPRNLSAFSLPPAILSNLAVRTIAELDEPPVDAKAGPSKQPPPPTTQGALSCQSCPNTSFETVEEQRTHFKTDWHRYNAKARIEGKKVVKGEEWDDMADGMLIAHKVMFELTCRGLFNLWISLLGIIIRINFF